MADLSYISSEQRSGLTEQVMLQSKVDNLVLFHLHFALPTITRSLPYGDVVKTSHIIRPYNAAL